LQQVSLANVIVQQETLKCLLKRQRRSITPFTDVGERHFIGKFSGPGALHYALLKDVTKYVAGNGNKD
jgi:hypothetical protein